MTLANRVAPTGVVHAHPARGLFMGNRGIIHDPEQQTLLNRRWTTRAWIICRCDYGTRRRDVMGRNGRNDGAGWTELFFLDEVTALAAGHRPCFFCRPEAARAFASAFEPQGIRAAGMDRRLHCERLLSGGRREPLSRGALESLPDGAMIAAAGQCLASKAGQLLRWSFEGYGTPVDLRELGDATITLITPPSTVAALLRGYRPVWHPTADRLPVLDGGAG
jgi:hypothetical protein